MPDRTHRFLICNSNRRHQRINNLLHHHRSTNNLLHKQHLPVYLIKNFAQLKQLGALHESGVLTDAEFEAAKQKILGI